MEGLFEQVFQYSKSNAIRFHMPSHNGSDIGINTSMDITELSFSDNLLNGHGLIKKTEEKIASLYNCNHALMLTCGATIAVSIAINVAKSYGDTIVVVGDGHISIYNNARVQGMQVVKVTSVNQMKQINGKIGAVFVTSPNYFGKITLAKNWRYDGALLIVDESHGSHFSFSSELPNSQCNDCDILISSWHKGLPVLTGGAVLLCNDIDIYRQLLYSRKLIHSTSPNYLIMASMDRACDIMNVKGEEYYRQVIESINGFRSLLCNRYIVLDTDDITRVCISLQGMCANAYAEILEANNIFIEMAYNDILVLIVTPFNHQHLQELARLMNSIMFEKKCEFISPLICEKKEILKSEIEFINCEKALGRVCAQELAIYPPGVPILIVGDIINRQVLDFILDRINIIFGLVDGLLPVFKN